MGAPDGTWRNAMMCRSDDPDTGLHCMKERGHEGPHWVELEWEDEPDEPARTDYQKESDGST